MAIKLTLEEFEKIRDGEIFMQGVIPNSASGLFMTNGGGNLRWVAQKGYGHDWTIYCHWDYMDANWIKHNGDKVGTDANIKKCVDADPEVMKFYRH